MFWTAFDRLLRFSLVAMVLLYLALAIYFVAGRVMMPKLGTYQPQLIEFLNQRTGLQWQIEGLQGEWRRLNPVIRFDSLQASAADHPENTVLSIRGTELELDFGFSIIDRQPRFRMLHLQQFDLSLEQDDAGAWRLPGNRSSGAAPRFDWLEFVNRSHSLVLGRFSVQALGARPGEQGGALSMPAVAIHLQRAGEKRAMRLDQLAETSGQFRFQVRSQGAMFHRRADTRVYLHSEDIALSPWLLFFAPDWQLDNLRGEIWAHKERGAAWDFFAKIDDARLARSGDEPWLLHKMRLNIAAQGDGRNGVALWWNDLAAHWLEQPLRLPSAALEIRRERGAVSDVSLRTATVDIGQVSQIAVRSGLLEDAFKQLLLDLQLRGQLRDLAFQAPNFRNLQSMHIDAQLVDVGLAPLKHVPGATGISGYLGVSAQRGVLKLDAGENFSLSFPGVYREPLRFGSASGQVNWRLNDTRLHLGSNAIQLTARDHDAALAGEFYVNAGLSRQEQPTSMSLAIGVRDSEVAPLFAYLPYTVSGTLRDWLAASGARGQVRDGGFIYNGSLRKGDQDRRSIALYFNLADTSASFDRRWPEVTELDGLLHINDNRTQVDAVAARFRGLALTDTTVAVGHAVSEQFVDVDTRVDGRFSDALAVLKSEPLQAGLGQVIGEWQGEGALHDGHLQLRVPLQFDDFAQTRIDFEARLEAVDLDLVDLGLSLESLSGELHYDSQLGLRSDLLQGQLWGQPLRAQLGFADPADASAANVYLSATGPVAPSALERWLQLPFTSFAQGQAEFTLGLAHSDGETRLQVDSSLQGLALKLPGELDKPAALEAPLQLRWVVADDDEVAPMHLAVDQRLEALLQFRGAQLLGGRALVGRASQLALSGSAEPFLPESALDPVLRRPWQAGELRVAGNLLAANVDEWQLMVERYSDAQQRIERAAAGAGAGDDAAGQQLVLDRVEINELLVLDLPLHNAVLSSAIVDERWAFDIESDEVKGNVLLPSTSAAQQQLAVTDDDPAAMQVLPKIDSELADEYRLQASLDYLRLPDSDVLSGGDSQADLLHPPNLLALDVAIDQLYLGNRPFGRWAFRLTPTDRAALLHAIEGQIESLTIRSDEDNGLLWAIGNQGERASTLNLQLEGSDIERVIEGWSEQEKAVSPIRAEKARFDIALDWAESPQHFALPLVDGEISFELESGQFLRASESATGLLKLVGLLNFDSLVRRLQLDFSDLVDEGLAFDEVSGRLDFAENVISFRDQPIEIDGPSSTFVLDGSVDLNRNEIDAELIATLPVAGNLPWIAALAGGLPVAAGVYIASKVFEPEIERLSSAVYRIQGPLNDPEARFDRLFDDEGSAVATSQAPAAEGAADSSAEPVPRSEEPAATDN